MNFLDALIVKIAKRVLGAVMAIGAGLVYLQFVALFLLFGAVVSLGCSAVLAVFMAAMFGV